MLAVVLLPKFASAQDALRTSLAGDAAAEARRLHPEAMPYTFKSGDFRLLLTPSVEADWNDNVYLAKQNAQDDFILRPLLTLDASYPVTQNNLLALNLGVGYDKYVSHDDLSAFRLTSGSALSFDMYVKDFWINLHDRISYLQDSATQAAVANTGSFGTINNSAGLSITWDLQDLTLTAGYDHVNVISGSGQFKYMNHSSESILTRLGFRLNPRVTAGLEGSGSFTAYDQNSLNNNQDYSVGAYADWQPGPALRIQPRAGYTIFHADQTSVVTKASDQNTWYADLTLSHEITDLISYSLSAGHEIRLGITSDNIEDTYVRPGIGWKLIKDVNLHTSLFYEHGKQSATALGGVVGETYDQVGGSIEIGYELMKKLSTSLSYRATFRTSTDVSREYDQDLIGLRLTYKFQ